VAGWKVITIDPRPEDPDNLPPFLKRLEGALPLADIDLSLDDKYHVVPGLGEMNTCSDPFNPKLVGKVEVGGIAKGAAHPNGKALHGPQMVEISRDGKTRPLTNFVGSCHGTTALPR
jgi:selenium-binding protein 1